MSSTSSVDDLTLGNILNDPILKERVLQFCAKQYSEENILFLDEFLAIAVHRVAVDPKIQEKVKTGVYEVKVREMK